MRSLVYSLLLAPCLVSAQAKYQVWVGGKKAGTATLLQKVLADGSKSVQLALDLKGSTVEAKLRAESTYDAKGKAIRKFQETLVPVQKLRRTVVVTFDAKGANATIELNGKRTVKHVPLPETADRADVSEFWFLRDKPKPGQVVKAYNFSIETLSWSLVATSYVGLVDAMIGGKKVKAHKTQSENGVALIDDAGMPLRLELSNGSLERIWP